MQFDTVKKAPGFNAEIEVQNMVIRDRSRFREVWLSLHGEEVGLTDIPEIDFDEKMVLLTIMDTQPTGGYTVRITRVGFLGNRIGVMVRKQVPGPGCATTQAVTQPYHLVTVERGNATVKFFEATEENRCK